MTSVAIATPRRRGVRLLHSQPVCCLQDYFINMSRKRGVLSCSVPGCTNISSKKSSIAYFKHPDDVARRKEWLKLIGRTELMNKPAKKYCVCEEHFHVRDVIFGKQRTLTATALPALNLPQKFQPQLSNEAVLPVSLETDIKTEIDDDIKTEIDDGIEPEEILPDVTRKIRSESPLPGCSKIEKVEESQHDSQVSVIVIGYDAFKNMCNRFLPKDLVDFTKAQRSIKQLLEEKNRQKRNNRFCLNLFLSSPRVYLMLQTMFGLPSPKTFKLGPVSSHLGNDAMKMLASKVKNMTEQEKECSVLIKTISIKPSLLYSISDDKIIGFQEIYGIRTGELAVRAQVIMVRGMFSSWKLPIAYALLSEVENSVHLNTWVDGILEKLVAIGLKIRTFVSDTGNEYIQAAEIRSVTVEKPYFFIGNRKVYYIFEAPHLFLMARNHFQLYDFVFEDRVAKYAHVKLFYENDKNKEFKNAPKLTKNHVFPSKLAKTKIKYARELFSNSVATGISNYISFGYIDCYASDTAEFIRFMNNLYDCFNSFDLKDNTYQFKKAFRGDIPHIDCFNEMLIYFRNLKLVHPTDGSDFTHQATFIKGFQTTINSVTLLFEDLKSEGFTYLLTRRLNFEPLDLFVDQLRTKAGMKSAPTSWQFISAFRKSFFVNIIKPLKQKYTQEEFLSFMTETKKVNRIITCTSNHSKSGEESSITSRLPEQRSIKRSDYNQLEVPLENRHFLVSYHLLMKCAEVHACGLFELYCKPHILNTNFSKEIDRYMLYSEYINANPGRLKVVPSDAFVQFIENMDLMFVSCLRRMFMNNVLAGSLHGKLKELKFNGPCSCFPKDYLINLFIRFRIYNILKFNNQQFRSSKDNTKTMIVHCL